MFEKFFFLFFVFLVFPLTVNAEDYAYQDETYHYSFIVPAGWMEIPKATIDETFMELADITGGPFVDYAAAFEVEGGDSFVYPYLLIQEHDYYVASYSELLGVLGSDNAEEVAKRAVVDYSEVFIDAAFYEPFYDEDRNAIFTGLNIEVVDIGETRCLMVLFLGGESVIQLNFYSLRDEYANDFPIFSAVIESFEFDSDYLSDRPEEREGNSLGLLGTFIGYGIIGGVVALILPFFSGEQRKKDGKK